MEAIEIARLYRVWRGMHDRCSNEKQKSFKDYGGRGIKVCGRWQGDGGFDAFLSDMGPRPFPGASIERKDNNGHYEPGNCIWATKKQQVSNKRNNRYITANGKTQTMAEWARELGCTPGAILYRIKRGMPEEQAVTMAVPERPNAKLTMEQATEIRAIYPALSAEKICKKYGVSKKTVLNVLHGKVFTASL